MKAKCQPKATYTTGIKCEILFMPPATSQIINAARHDEVGVKYEEQ